VTERSLDEQLRLLADALAAGEAVPTGRLLGLPNLTGDDYWVDTAGAAALLRVSPKTLTSWLSRGGPKSSALPRPHRLLYRLYWRRSELDAWAERRPGFGS
jgi:predicted DNA-binding transcriptional regulator AlpA